MFMKIYTIHWGIIKEECFLQENNSSVACLFGQVKVTILYLICIRWILNNGEEHCFVCKEFYMRSNVYFEIVNKIKKRP